MLWLSIPLKLREKALVFTDGLEAYGAVFAKGQHQAEGKNETTKMERLNNPLRQRRARLVRNTPYFSRSWNNNLLTYNTSCTTITLINWQKHHPYFKYSNALHPSLLF
ncbi:IS1 family transposase [Pontibacter toksunensis]|uniref:IS1 family transposase n=1 Tax=Pontibacter toksunensis TaxID=1332631 RepID=A0ABW6BYA3_9BACT